MTVPAMPLSVADVLDAAAVRPEPPAPLRETFENLMNHPSGDVSVDAGSTSPLTQAVLDQDVSMRRMAQSLRDLGDATVNGKLTADEMSAHQLMLMPQIAAVQFQFNTGVYLAQGAKSGLNTLMKNQ